MVGEVTPVSCPTDKSEGDRLYKGEKDKGNDGKCHFMNGQKEGVIKSGRRGTCEGKNSERLG